MPSRNSLIFSAFFTLTTIYAGNSVEAVETGSPTAEYEYEYTDFNWVLGGDISGDITIGPNSAVYPGTVESTLSKNLKLTLGATHSRPAGDGWQRTSPWPGSVDFSTFMAISNAAGLITDSTLTNSGNILGDGNVEATATNSLLANGFAFPVPTGGNDDTLESSVTTSTMKMVRRNALWSYDYGNENPTLATKEIDYTASLYQKLNPVNSGSSINDWTSEFTWSTSVQVPTTRIEYRRARQVPDPFVVPGPWPVFGLVSFVAYARKLKSSLRSCD
ncbi:hypothetical protein [Synechococcus sp. MIT S9501]|uniref:hypothetical protein n=1 Tax=Synechococcus sp. MIT S9501 TaxID=3082545 RepID=UPI0039B3B42D